MTDTNVADVTIVGQEDSQQLITAKTKYVETMLAQHYTFAPNAKLASDGREDSQQVIAKKFFVMKNMLAQNPADRKINDGWESQQAIKAKFDFMREVLAQPERGRPR